MHRKCSGVDPGRADMHVGVGREGGRCTGLLRCQVDRGENRTLTLLAVVDQIQTGPVSCGSKSAISPRT